MKRLSDHLRVGFFGALLFCGLGTGTIGEQRARLPPPATCDDPVVGVWKSHTYTTAAGRWDEFHVEIRREEGSQTGLVGKITNHAWEGSVDEVQPPADCGWGDRTRFSTDGRGKVQGNHVKFWGEGQPRIEEMICGQYTGTYNLDHFEGDIDAELQEFQSMNNDGGVHVNFPIVFRRIKCFTGDEELHAVEPVVAPPPFQPPAGGCSWW